MMCESGSLHPAGGKELQRVRERTDFYKQKGAGTRKLC